MHALVDDQVQLWLAAVPECEEPALPAHYAALLNADESARWQRFRYPLDQQRFLLGRALVRTVLGQLLARDPASLQFSHNAHGKPALREEHGSLPLHFNLSHTQGMLALALCRNRAVGVDVESVRRDVGLLELSRRFFAVREHAGLEALDGTEQCEHFFLLWTLKEAWLKARGLGLTIPLDDFAFDVSGAQPRISFGPQLDEEPADWQFRVYPKHDYRVALAVHCPEEEALDVVVKSWQPLLFR